MSEPAFVAATLAWCNDMRAVKGMEPLDVLPKGRRYDGASCPCGTATGLHVQACNAYDPEDRAWLCELPDGVKCFVQQFDIGNLPQYIEGAS